MKYDCGTDKCSCNRSEARSIETNTVCCTQQGWRLSTTVEPIRAVAIVLQHLQQKHEDCARSTKHRRRWSKIVEFLKGSCDCSPDYLTLLHFCLCNQQSWTFRILFTQSYIPAHSVDNRIKCVRWKSYIYFTDAYQLQHFIQPLIAILKSVTQRSKS